MDYGHSDSIIRSVSMYYNKNDYEAFCVFINKIADPKIIVNVGDLVHGNINNDLLDKFLNDDNISDIIKFGLFYGLEICIEGNVKSKYILQFLYKIKEINNEMFDILKTDKTIQLMKLYGNDFGICLLDKLSKDKFNELLGFMLDSVNKNSLSSGFSFGASIENNMYPEIIQFYVSIYFKHQYFDNKHMNKIMSYIYCYYSPLSQSLFNPSRYNFWTDDLVKFLYFCISDRDNCVRTYNLIQVVIFYVNNSNKNLTNFDIPLEFLLGLCVENELDDGNIQQFVYTINSIGVSIKEILGKKNTF